MTWPQILQNKRVSLMHNAIKEPQINNTTLRPPNVWTSIHSHVWRAGNSPYQSVFIDISTRPEKELSVIQMAKQEFPESIGVIPHREGKNRVLLEFAFDDIVLQRALTVGLEFSKNKTRILGARAMPNKRIVRKLHLTRLPLVRKAELLRTLQQSLQPYGRILDIGSFREPTTSFFIGSGYAILDCQPVTGEHPYQVHKHIIDWADEDEHTFYATWADMPLHCTWCNEQGHHRRDCPKLNGSQKECWSCHEVGHISRECPYSNGKKRKTAGGGSQRVPKGTTKGKKGKSDEETDSSKNEAQEFSTNITNTANQVKTNADSSNNRIIIDEGKVEQVDENNVENKNDNKTDKKGDKKDDSKDYNKDDKKEDKKDNIIGIDDQTMGNERDNITTESDDNNTVFSHHGDGEDRGLSPTIDAEGDSIIESLEALIEEHAMAEIPSQPDLDNKNTAANTVGFQEDMNYISSLFLKNATRYKVDNLSVMARRQLIKKIETLTQSDTVAGQRLRALRKQNHHQFSRGRVIRPSAKGIEALAHSKVSLGRSVTESQ